MPKAANTAVGVGDTVRASPISRTTATVAPADRR